MSAPPYMKLYVADWTADTTHLSCEQDGAYGRLVRAMWRAGGSLKNDPQRLANICGLTLDRWLEIGADVLELFDSKGEAITHKRVKKEAKKYRDTVAKNQANGRKGGVQSGLNRRKRKADSIKAVASISLAEKRSERRHNQNQNQTPKGELIDSSPFRGCDAPALPLDGKPVITPEEREKVKELMAGLAADLASGALRRTDASTEPPEPRPRIAGSRR